MDNGEGVTSSDGRICAVQQVNLLPGRRSAVQTACQDAATALDRLCQLLIETPSDDPSVQDTSLESAFLRMRMTVSVLRCSACEGPADIREKCRIFSRLNEFFPPGDPWLQLVARDLLLESADMLEDRDVV